MTESTPTRPNIVMIVLDDLGFAQLGCFGSDIATPTIDGLAAHGLRYSNFHVTALCAPTRACLMTGRNHHAVGMGDLLLETRFPGYTGRIPISAGTLPRHLRDAGYATLAVGKWHLTPRGEQSAAGPFDRWPTGLGFQHYYGFLGGMTSQWVPDLVRDNGYVDPPLSPDDGYHLTEDLTEQAIRMLHDHHQAAPNHPFFLYFAPGAVHQPHHVPAVWADHYRGAFDDGWEAWRRRAFAKQVASGVVPRGTTVTERPHWVAEWSAQSEPARRLYARMMEVFAGFLTHTDAQIGRLLSYLDEVRVLDNTVVMVLSDNGASADGGPHGWLNQPHLNRIEPDDIDALIASQDLLGGHRAYNHYSWGWAWAGNTPFRLWKRYAWLGGVRVPLIVSWPDGFPDAAAGSVRREFGHAIDLMPTILDLIGVTTPQSVDGVAQQPIDGRSLAATMRGTRDPAQPRTQYFEMHGSRAIYHDGWKATTDHVDDGVSLERAAIPGSLEFATDRWELFRLTDDFAEAHDVSDAEPDQLRTLVDLWWHEAGRNHVTPLMTARERVRATLPPEQPVRRRVWLPGGGPTMTAPRLVDGFRLSARIELGDHQPAAGILVAQGDWNGGWAVYVHNGCPVLALTFGDQPHQIAANQPLTRGTHIIDIALQRSSGGPDTLELEVDGESIGTASIPHRRWGWLAGLWLPLNGPRIMVACDLGLPVTDQYRPPFRFTGTVHSVIIEIPVIDSRAHVRDAADVAVDSD